MNLTGALKLVRQPGWGFWIRAPGCFCQPILCELIVGVEVESSTELRGSFWARIPGEEQVPLFYVTKNQLRFLEFASLQEPDILRHEAGRLIELVKSILESLLLF